MATTVSRAAHSPRPCRTPAGGRATSSSPPSSASRSVSSSGSGTSPRRRRQAALRVRPAAARRPATASGSSRPSSRPLIIRKPGAALFAEIVAAGVSALLGSQWGADTLLSGLRPGLRPPSSSSRFTLYRLWYFPVLALAAVASAAAAWLHDWALYYADVDLTVQICARHRAWPSRPRSSPPAAPCSSHDRCSGPACSTGSRTDRRARGDASPGRPVAVAPATSRSPTRGAARPALTGVASSVPPGQRACSSSGRRGRGKSTLAPGRRRARARATSRRRRWRARSTVDGVDDAVVRRRPPSRRGSGSCSRTREPARHGAGRGRRRVRAGEPGLAVGAHARAACRRPWPTSG